MSEPTADDMTRQAVLGALLEGQKSKEAPKVSATSSSEITEKTTFAELLERSLSNRKEEKDETMASDEERQKVIKESQVDAIDGIMKRLL